MIPRDRTVPPPVKQPAVVQHLVEVRGRRTGANRRAAKMRVGAETFVTARRDLPARLPDPARQIRLVPLGRTERLIERPDVIETRAPDDPRANHDVDFLQAEPVRRPGTNRALQTPLVD